MASLSYINQLSISQLQDITNNFVNELTQASLGQTTSLPFIRINLPKTPLIRKHQATYQAMAIGGTNFHQALVHRSSTGITLDRITVSPLPQFPTSTDFYQFILEHTSDQIDLLTVNYAYALNPIVRDQLLDGTLLKGAKEHDFVDLFGHQIGYELEQYLQTKLNRHITVTLGNDTLCLALSKVSSSHLPQTIVSGVVGTGVNFGLFVDKHQFVNLESADFDKFDQTPTGHQLDQESVHVSQARFEKEVSGAYLYQHYNLVIDQLGEDAPHATSTDDLSVFASAGSNPHHLVAQQLLERSASLVACQIAGIYLFKNLPKLTFVMEGSLFWNAWHYQDIVIDYLSQLGIPDGAIHFSYIKNSSLIGAAQLALINAPHIPTPKKEIEEEEEKESEKSTEHSNSEDQKR